MKKPVFVSFGSIAVVYVICTNLACLVVTVWFASAAVVRLIFIFALLRIRISWYPTSSSFCKWYAVMLPVVVVLVPLVAALLLVAALPLLAANLVSKSG